MPLNQKYFLNQSCKRLEAKEKTVQEDAPLNAIYITFKQQPHSSRLFCSRCMFRYFVERTIFTFASAIGKEAKAFVEIDAYITASDDIGMFKIEGKVAEQMNIQAATDLIWKEK